MEGPWGRNDGRTQPHIPSDILKSRRWQTEACESSVEPCCNKPVVESRRAAGPLKLLFTECAASCVQFWSVAFQAQLEMCEISCLQVLCRTSWPHGGVWSGPLAGLERFEGAQSGGRRVGGRPRAHPEDVAPPGAGGPDGFLMR